MGPLNFTMEKTTKSKKLVSWKMLSAVVITMVATVVLAVWQIPTATATSLEELRGYTHSGSPGETRKLINL
jgi:hypothetical protein